MMDKITPMLDIKDLSVSNRLMPMSFQVNSGEIVHVIGPNGSGKSTLLEVLAGLLSHQGTVAFNGESIAQYDLKELAKIRAYLCQSDRPAFNMSVFQYLSLSISKDAHHDLVEKAVGEITTQLCITDKLGKSIHHLSGGEWQRVRLAGVCLQVWPTLNSDAKVLLLDEPAAPLDVGQESLLYQMIKVMASKGLTVVMANHDLNRTLRHSDKVLILKEGVLKAVGETKSLLTSQLMTEIFSTQVTRIEHDGQTHLLFD
ncbi:vitamin B12 import ATP-binding protein BtuD [Vibrio algivorus]|uniref:Vitamin B12 import ATP-binding protein BtuD n=2 Tax=Vibrio algivorus TaxID=1667024 RepID=A0ABQ6ELH2_9VIBR|nr:vitamin B12 import ATP-binding protein BtuD [Vibrio algivorus]